MNIFTIGFTKTSAKSFFDRLTKSGVKKLIDVRLNNVSQLAGFAKRDDLEYFTDKICSIGYKHLPVLAPSKELLDQYRKNNGSWDEYKKGFNRLIGQRKIEEIDKDLIDGSCLLCSGNKPHHCHRKLVAEYLQEKWGNVTVVHL